MKMNFSQGEIALMIDFALKNTGGAPVKVANECQIISLTVSESGGVDLEIDTGAESEPAPIQPAKPKDAGHSTRQRDAEPQPCANPECDEVFTPYNSRQKICGKPDCVAWRDSGGLKKLRAEQASGMDDDPDPDDQEPDDDPLTSDLSGPGAGLCPNCDGNGHTFDGYDCMTCGGTGVAS